ncbi:MAG: cupin domain-containing protein [Chloroflexi bacterium]|nr:cupin domain-containing protein [Chloroflexota bacterium]
MSDLVRCSEVTPKVFATRETRVLAGAGGLPAERFVLGYVVVQPGGEVPGHAHEQEEVYLALEGRGEIVVGEVTHPLDALSAVYIPSGAYHCLTNTGESVLKFVFVYAPGGEVSHWAQEAAALQSPGEPGI